MGEELFDALHAVQLQMLQLSFDELKQRLIAVGDELAPRFLAQGSSRAADAVRFRVAEDILAMAVCAWRPIDECLEYWRDVAALGFESLEKKAHNLMLLCGHFSHRAGHHAVITELLSPLCDELRAALNDGDADDAGDSAERRRSVRYYLATCEDILARVRAQQANPHSRPGDLPDAEVDAMIDEARRALHEIRVRRHRVSFDDTRARLIAVRDRLAPSFLDRGSPAASREVRRLVAEELLAAALHARRPGEECLGYLRALAAFGFARLSTEVHYAVAVCELLSQQPGHERLVRELLSPLRDRLRADSAVTEDSYERRYVDACERLLAGIEPQSANDMGQGPAGAS
jgi:hypothetical protein